MNSKAIGKGRLECIGVYIFLNAFLLPLRIPYLLCVLPFLSAWTQDALIPVIMREPTLSMERKIMTVRSLSKVMWIQNDLFSRHYIGD